MYKQTKQFMYVHTIKTISENTFKAGLRDKVSFASVSPCVWKTTFEVVLFNSFVGVDFGELWSQRVCEF